MLKGMSTKQFKEIQEFVQKHHHFAKWVSEEKRKKELELYPNIEEHGLNIKYIDSCYDTRGGDIWMITFRSFSKITFRTNQFVSINPAPKNFKYTNLYDWVIDYLKGEWKDEEIIKTLKE